MLLQYEFTRIDGKTKLTGVTKISQYAQDHWTDSFHPGFTLYWRQCAEPARDKLPARPLTDRWYSIVEADDKIRGLDKAIKQLIHPPFTRSMDEGGNNIEPVILPLNLSKTDNKVWED